MCVCVCVCESSDGGHVKDLSRLGRPLSRMVLVDNTFDAYLFHTANGIPIPSFYGHKSQSGDRELDNVLGVLESLAAERDVRPAVLELFKPHKILSRL